MIRPMVCGPARGYDSIGARRGKREEMVNWCENCGAFLGLCEPISDWTTKRIAYCLQCAPEPSLRLRAYLTMNPHASPDEVVIALARAGTRVNERMVDYVKQFLA